MSTYKALPCPQPFPGMSSPVVPAFMLPGNAKRRRGSSKLRKMPLWSLHRAPPVLRSGWGSLYLFYVHQVSQLQQCQHFGPHHSVMGTVLCSVGCLGSLFSNISGFNPGDSSSIPYLPSHDNPKCFLTLSNVACGNTLPLLYLGDSYLCFGSQLACLPRGTQYGSCSVVVTLLGPLKHILSVCTTHSPMTITPALNYHQDVRGKDSEVFPLSSLL